MQNQAGKRFWIIHLKRMAISLLVVAVAGLLWDRWMTSDSYGDSNAPVEVALISIAVYLAVVVATGLVHVISGALYLWWFGGKDMQAEVLEDLRRSRLPGPTDWQPKRFDYLEMLAGDSDADPDDRVKAGALYAAYQVAYQRAGFFAGVALAQAWDNAALRYAEEAPQPRRD